MIDMPHNRNTGTQNATAKTRKKVISLPSRLMAPKKDIRAVQAAPESRSFVLRNQVNQIQRFTVARSIATTLLHATPDHDKAGCLEKDAVRKVSRIELRNGAIIPNQKLRRRSDGILSTICDVELFRIRAGIVRLVNIVSIWVFFASFSPWTICVKSLRRVAGWLRYRRIPKRLTTVNTKPLDIKTKMYASA